MQKSVIHRNKPRSSNTCRPLVAEEALERDPFFSQPDRSVLIYIKWCEIVLLTLDPFFCDCRRWGCTPPCPRYGSSWRCSSCWCTCSRGAAIATRAENAASPPGSGYWGCLRSSAGECHYSPRRPKHSMRPAHPRQRVLELTALCSRNKYCTPPRVALVIEIWSSLSVGSLCVCWQLVHVITAAVNANVGRLVGQPLFRQQLIWIISRASEQAPTL